MKKFVAHSRYGPGGVGLRLRGTMTASLSLIFVIALDTTALAQFDVDTKITASDAVAFGWFGRSVAISGNTAIVGARLDGDAERVSGSAYLIDVTTGIQRVKLNTRDPQEEDQFGVSVDISGNTAIVGARLDGDACPGFLGLCYSGSAYLFDVATGNELFKLTASDAASDDLFGNSVAIDGSRAIVGARGDDHAGVRSGSAYLFDVTTGHQLFKLTASDATERDDFGWSVAISGDVAIVGADGDDDGGSLSGSAYLFDATTGQERFKLTASDAAPGDSFGISVAISGNTAMVGAPRDDDAGSDSGAAYVYDVITGKELFKLTASDAEPGDRFGQSVDISGNTAIIGAYLNDDNASAGVGSAYLFDVTTGKQLSKLTASDARGRDDFGKSVGISGDTAIVGAHLDDNTGFDSGSVYLFTNTSLPSDLTGNGFVDFEDLTILLANWNKPGATPAEGNLVNAATTPVNFEDLTVLLADWTGPGPAGSPEAALGGEAVPEPSTLLLAVIATLGLSACRRRRRPPGLGQPRPEGRG